MDNKNGNRISPQTKVSKSINYIKYYLFNTCCFWKCLYAQYTAISKTPNTIMYERVFAFSPFIIILTIPKIDSSIMVFVVYCLCFILTFVVAVTTGKYFCLRDIPILNYLNKYTNFLNLNRCY